MDRRIYGLETEYGITCTLRGQRRLSPDEVARSIFGRVVAWGRSSNVFLPNGGRLYLDVGSHPEYATAECDDLLTLIAQDRAGEQILEGLGVQAQARLAEEGVGGRISLFKNNTDTVGNSYGCHENYLISRQGDFTRIIEPLIAFLVTRPLLTGAGTILSTPQGPLFCVSQRAEHIWESVSSATTRSRPLVNTRDEPHADAERYRRLHVIGGDSNMAEPTTLLKVGSCALLLHALESGSAPRDLTLDNPMRALREVSRDPTGRCLLRLTDGREITPLELLGEYYLRARSHAQACGLAAQPTFAYVLDLWGRGLQAIESGDLDLVATELDWVIKDRLIQRYLVRHGLRLGDPRVAMVNLAYHDIDRDRGLYHVLARGGAVRRLLHPLTVFRAKTTPPQTTRARLRGEFIAAAQARRRDFTVDWVHLKLNDQAQRTVLCKDPFRSVDERVERLIAGM